MSTNTPADSKSVLDAYVEAINSGDYNKLFSVFAPNFRRVAPDWSAESAAETIQGVRKLLATYQGFRLTINEAVFGPELGFSQWTVNGGFPGPDGKIVQLEVQGASMMRFEGGLMTEERVYFDSAAVTSALNVSTMPHAAS